MSSTEQQKSSNAGAVAPAGAEESSLKAERVQLLLEDLPGWRLTAGGRSISRTFRFPGVSSALAFTSFVSAVASESGHGPAVHLEGSRVVCWLTTQAAGGLTLQDLETARRISLLA
jgi:4a-hydroxytetrahydrobiopterin dehydratase